ncbi:MAG: ribonuclease III [Bacteroidales bacterium]|nr:ribonuclease III [Bacteroidales bacterium]
MLVKDFLSYHISSDKELRKAIKNVFGFYPGNVFLYKQAFRHKSASIVHKNGVKINNERQEYLGDAILSSVVAHYLFQRFPGKDEGFLTEMRSKIVSRSSLNRLAEKMGLMQFVKISATDAHLMKSAGGNAFEAFIGALYLDKGYQFTKKIIIKRILAQHFDLEELMNKEISYKSKMIEWAQKEKINVQFSVIDEQNVKGQKQFHVALLVDEKPMANAFDYSIKGAENLAAEKAWAALSHA